MAIFGVTWGQLIIFLFVGILGSSIAQYGPQIFRWIMDRMGRLREELPTSAQIFIVGVLVGVILAYSPQFISYVSSILQKYNLIPSDGSPPEITLTLTVAFIMFVLMSLMMQYTYFLQMRLERDSNSQSAPDSDEEEEDEVPQRENGIEEEVSTNE